MDQALVVTLGKQALRTLLLVAAPMLGFALIGGLLVSVFQAVTSIQDMTLTFIPKIMAAVLAIILFLPWMLRTLMDFTVNILVNLPQ